MFSAFPVYIAVWVKVVLEKNAVAGGSLQTVWSIGVISASFLLTFLANKKHTKTVVPIALICVGVLIFPIGLVSSFVLALAILLFAGLSSGVANIHLEGFLQRTSEGKGRARILAAFMAINSALVPFGYAGGGILSDLLNPFWLFVTIAIPAPLTAWLVLKSILLHERANKSEQEEQVGL
jgi:MFS family permease